jgi:hypothetical protein
MKRRYLIAEIPLLIACSKADTFQNNGKNDSSEPPAESSEVDPTLGGVDLGWNIWMDWQPDYYENAVLYKCTVFKNNSRKYGILFIVFHDGILFVRLDQRASYKIKGAVSMAIGSFPLFGDLLTKGKSILKAIDLLDSNSIKSGGGFPSYTVKIHKCHQKEIQNFVFDSIGLIDSTKILLDQILEFCQISRIE